MNVDGEHGQNREKGYEPGEGNFQNILEEDDPRKYSEDDPEDFEEEPEGSLCEFFGEIEVEGGIECPERIMRNAR